MDSTEPEPLPYATPKAVLEAGARPRAVFLAWEKLRPVYNGVLVILTLAAMAALGLPFDDLRLGYRILTGAVIANVSYLAGPAIESYVRWLWPSATWVRPVLFTLGTFFTGLLAGAHLALFGLDF